MRSVFVVLRDGWVGYNNINMIKLRQATVDDLKSICKFTNWWLAGRGKAKGVIGAVNDYFISPSQHRKYIVKYKTVIVLDGAEIICWAVLAEGFILIHLLVAEPYRGRGIGRSVVKFLFPRIVRSESNQSTGNPIGFYEKLGYRLLGNMQRHCEFSVHLISQKQNSTIDVLKFDGGL